MKPILVSIGILSGCVGLSFAAGAAANVWQAWQLPVADAGKPVIYQINATVTDNAAIAGPNTQFETSFHNCSKIATQEVGGDTKIASEKDKILDLFEDRFQSCMEAAENDQGQSMWELGEMNAKQFSWSESR